MNLSSTPLRICSKVFSCILIYSLFILGCQKEGDQQKTTPPADLSKNENKTVLRASDVIEQSATTPSTLAGSSAPVSSGGDNLLEERKKQESKPIPEKSPQVFAQEFYDWYFKNILHEPLEKHMQELEPWITSDLRRLLEEWLEEAKHEDATVPQLNADPFTGMQDPPVAFIVEGSEDAYEGASVAIQLQETKTEPIRKRVIHLSLQAYGNGWQIGNVTYDDNSELVSLLKTKP